MSSHNKKDGSSKVQLFEKDSIGDIKPLYPKDGEAEMPPAEEPEKLWQESSPLVPLDTNLSSFNHLIEEASLPKEIPPLPPVQEPSPSTSTDNIQTLRKYISVKETEVRDLQDQLKQYQQVLSRVTSELKDLKAKNSNYIAELDEVKSKGEGLRKDYIQLRQKLERELEIQKNDYELKLRNSQDAESQIELANRQKQEWKTKVREDLNRIKLKEKEIENKYELLKRDTQTLLDAKDKQYLELKKKNDALDLDLESLEDRLRQNNQILSSMNDKKKRLVETLKLAIALLEEIDSANSDPK